MIYELFSDILSDNFPTQMVVQPTRGNKILDLVLTNNSDVICDVEVSEPILVNVHPYHQNHLKENFMISTRLTGHT